MPRYLSEVNEYVYPDRHHPDGCNTVLFSRPNYDSDSRITLAFYNLSGENAQHKYIYGSDKIIVSIGCNTGEIITRTFFMKDNIINSCTETTTVSSEIKQYEYFYDANKRLIKTAITSDETDAVNIKWDGENLSQVEYVTSKGTVLEEYRFEYLHNRKHNAKFPYFQLSCYYLGSVFGIDEILMAEGYYGNSISADLPVKEYFIGILSREFEYSIDDKGYITKISQLADGKTIRDYNLIWR